MAVEGDRLGSKNLTDLVPPVFGAKMELWKTGCGKVKGGNGLKIPIRIASLGSFYVAVVENRRLSDGGRPAHDVAFFPSVPLIQEVKPLAEFFEDGGIFPLERKSHVGRRLLPGPHFLSCGTDGERERKRDHGR